MLCRLVGASVVVLCVAGQSVGIEVRATLVGDGTHPSNTGRQKVAEQLLQFFKTDAHTKTWFVKK